MTGNLRERILVTAATRFSEVGYDAVSMREIAESVGVTKAALYYHFRDKQELLATILIDSITEIDETVDRACADCRTAQERIGAFVKVVFSMAPEKRAMMRFASRDMGRLETKQRQAVEQVYYSRFIGRVTEIIEEGVRKAELRTVDARFATWLLLGMMYPFFDRDRALASDLQVLEITTTFLHGVSA